VTEPAEPKASVSIQLPNLKLGSKLLVNTLGHRKACWWAIIGG
jgi:hypothetical protein